MDPSHASLSSIATADASRPPASWAGVARHLALRIALLATVVAPASLMAQTGWAVGDGYYFRRPMVSLTLRGGVDRPTASSDIWSFTTRNLTVNKNDFLSAGVQLDLGVRVSSRTELVFAAGSSQRSTGSEFRDYIDNNDQPIEQTTRLRRAPVTAGVRFALAPPEERLGRLAWVPARLTPWIGVGGGAMNYEFSQRGDFVDFQTLNVFRQAYEARGWTPMGYANIGADLRVSTRLWLTGDLRYSLARAPLDFPGSKFVGFNRIDLSGTAATMGLTVRI